ncbi:MAG: NAD(P)H-dependent oxidoreductase [Roseovarius sp.]
MKTTLGISGSLRKASFNAGLLCAAAALAPEGAQIKIGSITDVPLYNADVETAPGAAACGTRFAGPASISRRAAADHTGIQQRHSGRHCTLLPEMNVYKPDGGDKSFSSVLRS